VALRGDRTEVAEIVSWAGPAGMPTADHVGELIAGGGCAEPDDVQPATIARTPTTPTKLGFVLSIPHRPP
jgi:hypothetical protein